MNILEHKGNYLILKEYNILKLYSYKSLVCIYDTEKKQFEDVPYMFVNDDGDPCSHSSTTARHISKFKNYIINKGY